MFNAYEAEVLGDDAEVGGDSACEMPVTFQVERLNDALKERIGTGFSVRAADLYSLEGAERDAALDALGAGEPSPFVLLDGRLVCAGSVEVSAVLEALA